MKINGTIYSCVFFAMMRKNKKAYKMTKSDQFDLFFKALLICGVQSFFAFVVLYVGNVQFVL